MTLNTLHQVKRCGSVLVDAAVRGQFRHAVDVDRAVDTFVPTALRADVKQDEGFRTARWLAAPVLHINNTIVCN